MIRIGRRCLSCRSSPSDLTSRLTGAFVSQEGTQSQKTPMARRVAGKLGPEEINHTTRDPWGAEGDTWVRILLG